MFAQRLGHLLECDSGWLFRSPSFQVAISASVFRDQYRSDASTEQVCWISREEGSSTITYVVVAPLCVVCLSNVFCFIGVAYGLRSTLQGNVSGLWSPDQQVCAFRRACFFSRCTLSERRMRQ
eukprot:m.985080 g.985080  ORF g.985080 m.985080 type:complete len:123 (-) comp23981_c0_seq26:110-478(-)